MSYYIDENRNRIEWKTIGDRIKKEHPELIGKHICEQLDALGLRRGFDRGNTPIMLPYSFSDREDWHRRWD